MKSRGTRTEPSVHPGSSLSTPPTSRLVTIAERPGSFDESVGYSDAKEDDDEEYLEEKAAMPDLSEAAVVSIGCSGGVIPLARNLTEEPDDVAGPGPATEDSDDESDDLKPSAMTGKATCRSTGNQAPVNCDTPAANKVLVRQAVWMDLGGELSVPIGSDRWLRILCYSSVLWALRKWKKKLRTSFGVSEIGAGRQPIYSPTRTGSDGPIKAEASSYMQDSHMVTPRSASRSERLAEVIESLRPTPNTRQETGRRPARNYDSPEDSSDSDSYSGDFDYLDGDPTEEWACQIRELSKAETKSSTLRLELATHLPLGNIKPYFGLRNKSEKSMQWLRTFIYEMKGTHTPPNECCMAFELSLQDGALHWYGQLPRKTRRTWKLLSDAIIKYYCSRFTQSAKARYYSVKREDKEHVCDYLNRLNGYARNAGVQFGNGGRDAKDDHMEHFLDTVTVANALTDLVAACNVNDAARSRSNRPETRHHGYDSTETSSDDERRRDGSRCSSESSDSDHSLDGEFGPIAAANDSERRAAAEGTFARSDHRHPRGGNGHFNKDRGYGRDNRQRQRCKLCKQVHDAGKCDALNELTNLLRSKVDKKDLTPELQSLVLVPSTKLLPGERLGWWSSQWYDKRKRMRALVKGVVNDVRKRILLDTGANVSVISANYAKELRLREVPDHGRSLEVREINPGVLETRRRALVKITLGWERVYDFEMWIMNRSVGVDVVLGTDFMIPAGVRLDLFHGTARLPDEVMVPLIKSLSAADDELYGTQVVGGPTEDLYIPGHKDAEDSGPVEEAQGYCAEDMTQATATTSRECGRRDDSLAFRAVADTSDGVAVERIPTEESGHTIPMLESGDRVFEQAQRQSSTHATDDAWCTESSNTVTSENIGASGQVPDDSDDRVVHIPCPTEDPECVLNATYVSAMHTIVAGVVPGRGAEVNDVSEHLANDIELTDYTQELAFLPDLTEITVTALDYTGPNVQNKDLDVGQQQKLVDVLKHHEKIMISSDNALPPPAYGVVCGIDVQGHAPIKQRDRRTPLRFLGKLYALLKGLLRAGLITFSDSPWASPIVIVLKKNGVDIRLCIDYKMVNSVTAIMAYAMSLVDDLLTDMEAYLWFCSLDAASGFWAIMMTQRARKISAFVCALGHFEWLLMPFGLKNGPMIYLRMIDNAICGFVQPREAQPRARTKFEADRESSTVMDAVSQLVNSPTGDMFGNGESDESSLVPEVDRRSIVDDICFGNETFDGCLATLDRLLQRFTECRISVSFTKCIFVQCKVDFLSHEVSSEGIRADPKKIKAVTEVPLLTSKKGMQSFLGALNYYSRFIQDIAIFAALQQKVMDAPILRHFDRDKEDAEMNYHPAQKEILALLLLLKVCYTQLAGRTIHVYTRFSTLDWVHKSKALFGRTTQFAVKLSPSHLVVQRVKERDCAFAQLLQAGLTSFVDLDDSLAQVAPPTEGSPSISMDPNLLYAHLPRSYQRFVLSFDGSAKTEKHGGYGSCAWILWRLPEWTIVTAASAYLEGDHGEPRRVCANEQRSTSCIRAHDRGLGHLGDSRLAIQQSLGVIACHKESLLAQLNRHRVLTAKFRSVKYLHVVREFNAAADSLASETLESKVSKVVSTEARLSEFTTLNRIQGVIYEPTAKAETEDKPSVNTVRAHDPLQQDWDEIAEKLIFAINNSMDATRKETPFYVVHGCERIRESTEESADTGGDSGNETRFRQLLPEDSWEPDQLAGEYEVETILDDRVPLSTSTVREFKLKWLGYDEPTWEPASNLSCGGLLYDYLREKRSDRRLQMVQVADED
ncbi:Hypothetical protein PHPALM_36696 [Phytophthora palmivora]|uniref:RNA-directed DNA polymerase n=1 Tax=Phytophthora palmivora TaxID=4796 RepID=A0A2P4WZB3_9STRA|nr:Hypothetical protein PHPALM_36696 [Phytophthora palmivora]